MQKKKRKKPLTSLYRTDALIKNIKNTRIA